MQGQAHSRFDDERLAGRIGDLSDEIRRLESEVERSHRLATLGLLSGSIAHEFNNVLTPVLSYAQLALASPEDRELQQKALKKCVEGTQKAAQIASAMLGFVRDEESDTAADVAIVVREALLCLGRDLQKEGITVDIGIPAGIRLQIRPVALEQVLLNLILNAIEAIRPSIGVLRISARREVDVGVIEVRDSGRGMSTELAARVFEPFVTSGAKEGRRMGTGLGLTICKRLVEEAGGSIAVRSEAGKGTVFAIRIPAALSN